MLFCDFCFVKTLMLLKKHDVRSSLEYYNRTIYYRQIPNALFHKIGKH